VLTPGADPLHKVTIIPRGEYGGASMTLPEKDRYGYGLKWLKAAMIVACGGRIAEEMKTADVSSGAASDIAQVTNIARHMILEWGMSDRLGFIRYASQDDRDSFVAEKDYSPETAKVIDEEIRRLVNEAYDHAEKELRDNWSKVEAVAEALLRHETLTAEEVKKLIAGERLDKPSVSELLAAEAEKTKAPPAAAKGDQDEDDLPDAIPHPA
jgi:cell division protease FtsH